MCWNVTIDGFGLMTQFIAHFDRACDYTLQFTISLSLSHTHTHAHKQTNTQKHTHTHTPTCEPLTCTHACTHTCPQSYLHCHCSVAAFNIGRSPSSGFLNCPQPLLPASNSNSSQWLNPSSSLTATQSQSQIQSYIITNGQSASLSWCQATSEVQDQIFVAIRPLRVCSCTAPSDERMGLSFTIADGPCQCSHIYCDQNQQYMSSIFTILHVSILRSQLSIGWFLVDTSYLVSHATLAYI
jgi:hypothetical protein